MSQVGHRTLVTMKFRVLVREARHVCDRADWLDLEGVVRLILRELYKSERTICLNSELAPFGERSSAVYLEYVAWI